MSFEEKIIQADKVKPNKSKKKKKRVLITLFLLIILAATAYWYLDQSVKSEYVSISNYETSYVLSQDLITTTEASGTVVLPNQVTIVNKQSGYVDTLYVSEGDIISSDDILVSFSVPDYEDDMESYILELKEANTELESQLLENKYNIDNLNIEILRLDDEIIKAQEEVDKYLELSSIKNSYIDLYDNSLDSLASLEESLEDKKDELSYIKEKQEIEIIKQQSAIEKIKLNISQLEEDIQDLNIKSVISGEILSINEDLYIDGNYIESSQSLFSIADREKVYVDLDIYEQYASLLEVGDPLEITIGSQTMSASIISIGKVATMDSDGLSANITIRVKPETNSTLNPGASAVASIVLGVEEDVIQLPRGSYLTTGNQKYVYVVDGDKAYKTEVVYGDIQSNTVEILSGLEEKDQIITSSYQGFLSEDVIQLN